MDSPGSPSFTQHLTPGRAAIVRDRTCAETWVPIGTVGAHMLAAVIFLIGSLLLVASADATGLLIGGFFCYMVGTFFEFFEGCRSQSGLRFVRALTAVFHCSVAVAMLIDNATIVGVDGLLFFGFLMCFASLVDLVLVGITHEDRTTLVVHLENLKSWAGVVAIARFLAGVFFTLKYIYYKLYIMNDFEFQDGIPLALNVIASIFIITSGLARYPDMRVKLNAAKKALAPKDADTDDFA